MEEEERLLPGHAIIEDQIEVEHDGDLTLFREFKTLSSLAAPVVLSYVVSFSIVMAPVFSLGHLSTKYLAAAALSTMLCNVTGFSVGGGFATALDTLCSQAYTGSSDRYALGKHLQRALFVEALLCIPIITFWCFAEPLLLLLGQDAEIAAISGRFVLCMVPGLYPYLAFKCLSSYLQAQGIMKAGMYVMLIAAPLNAFLQWFLVWSPQLGLGAIGAPIASSITNFFIFGLGLSYTYFIEGGDRFGGFELKEILDWKQIIVFLQLGFPGALMLCTEWWAFEVLALAAGWLGDKYLAAQSIMINIGSLMFCVPYGLAAASTTRIGNSLGAMMPKTSEKIAKSSFLLAFLLAGLNCSFLVIVRDSFGYLFSSDEEVVQLVATVLPLTAFYQIFDGLACVGSGILRGCGRQRLGAILNVLGYYVIGLPLGFFLTFYMRYEILGLWMGTTTALIFVSAFDLVYILGYTDWNEESRRARTLVAGDDNSLLEEGDS